MKFKFLIIAVVVFLSSCFSYKDVEYKSFEGLNIEKIEGDDLHIALSVKLYNPNNYTIKVHEADLKANFNGKDLGDIKLMNVVKIDANKESVQKVICKVSSKKILAMLPMAFLTGKSTISINGDLRAKVFLFSKKFPVNVSQNINLGDLKL